MNKNMIGKEYLNLLIESMKIKNEIPYKIKKSNIHGNGVFSIKKFNKGDFIYLHFDKQRNITEFGKYLNHSNNPNAKTEIENNTYKTYAIKDIFPGDEITLNYTYRKELEQPEKDWR